MEAVGAVVAAINNDKSAALVALTSAALGLLGVQANAAVPVAQPEANVQYGHYQESDNRMQVDIYHADFIGSFADRLELSFSIDRDTYSGATPAFSIPETMTNQPKYKQRSDGQSASETTLVDIVSAASGGVTAGGLTILGGLNGFKEFQDASNAGQVQIAKTTGPLKVQTVAEYGTGVVTYQNSLNANQAGVIDQFNSEQAAIEADYLAQLGAINSELPQLTIQYNSDVTAVENSKSTELTNYATANPRPADPDSVSSGGTINFNGMTFASYAGKANVLPIGDCVGAGSDGCYQESGMVTGTVSDANPLNHLHQELNGFAANGTPLYQVAYHNDSAGIYMRAVGGQAFDLVSMTFAAPWGIQAGNVNSGSWEILGFSQASNPGLSSGDGTNYDTRVAYQTVNNTSTDSTNGTLNLNSEFQNVKALWIHFKGYPASPPAGILPYKMGLDNVSFAPVALPTQEQLGWDVGFNAFESAVNTSYQAQLTSLTDTYNAEVAALTAENAEEYAQVNNNYNASLAATNSQKDAELALLTSNYETQVAQLKTNYDQSMSAISSLEANLFKQISIEAYRTVLNRMVPSLSSTVQIYQQQPLETRTMPTFSSKYYFDDSTLALSGGMSEEPDFDSSFGSINFSRELNNKLTTLTAGYSLTRNQITRSTDLHGSDSGHAHGGDGGPDYPALNETSTFNGFNAGISQVLGKNTLFQSTANYTLQNGYLTNPYKYVYIRGEVTPEEYYELWQNSSGIAFDWKSITNLEMVGTELFREVRPDQRNEWALSNRINQYIPALDASLHFDYRFYTDDWGINSHTFDIQWYQSLPAGITVTPSIRYYSQSQADFFAPYFLAPRADGIYSSDFRLADFGALSGGVTFSKQFAKGFTLEAGFEYYTRQSDMKLGGGNDNSYADYDYYLVHAGMNVNLSAVGTPGGSQGDHHMHHLHSAPLPAGVMFGHMMNTPCDLMAGYRYVYADQIGDMRHGSHAVDDVSLVDTACGNFKCTSRPSEMRMSMHMLDLMYAPTDWLNLMLMPQIMDMKMYLSQIPGVTSLDEHGGSHSSGGLGDTIMAAMFKLYDTPGHHLHLGLAVSAPTGDVDVTLDGTNSSTSLVQDYGMQLGSGTWDLKPSLTYTGHLDDWSWGAQLTGTKRLQNRNSSGYVLGDVFQSSVWGGYNIFNWLSASIRSVYTDQGAIGGSFNRPHAVSVPVDVTSNYGGQFWDLGFGLNASVPDGAFSGHSLSVEWQQPVAENFNGYQLDREGSLSVTWNYRF